MVKKPKATPKNQSDMGTKELRQHHKIITETTEEKTKRARNITRTPIDWYLTRDLITELQWQAGDRIYRDFMHSGGYRCSTRNYASPISAQYRPPSLSNTQVEAREQFTQALEALEQEGQRIVMHVCCLSEWPSALDLPPRYTIMRLRSALDELVVFYGFLRKEKKNEKK